MSTIKLLLINLTLLLTIVTSAEVKRDKRTIDFVIRGFADVFGYDVMKRPSVITTLTAPNTTNPAKPAATGGPKAASPTSFPPPVAPLPPPTKIPLVPRATPAQPKVTAPPLLTETVRKNFNFTINWSKNVPQVPQTTAAMPTVMITVPVPPSPMATAAPAAPVGKNSGVPLIEQNIQYLYDDIEPHRFTAIKEHAYNDYHEQDEPRNLPVAQILAPMTDDPYNNYQQSKDKFRDSITEFWNHSPYYRDQKGYKFLTTPETNDVVKSLEPEKSPEDYDLKNVDYDEDKQALNDDFKEYAEEDEENEKERPEYNDIDAEEEDDDKRDATEEKDSYKAAESKETLQYPKHRDKNNTTKVETIIVSKKSCNHQKKSKPQLAKIKKNIIKEEIKNPAYKKSNSSEVIVPQLFGILPIAIDHLSLGEKNHIPWPIPFDTEASETNNNNKKKFTSVQYEIDPRRRRMDLNVVKSKRMTADGNYKSRNFRYIPDSYHHKFDYVTPEEKTENYGGYETVDGADDDEDLKKARVLMRSFGTKLNVLKSNREITNLN